MSTEFHVEDALERSLIAWLAATATHGITLGVTGRQEFQDDSSTMTLPTIVVKAERLGEAAPGTGNFQYRVTATLLTQADDTSDATQRQQWANLTAILSWDELSARLTTASLKVFDKSIIREDSMARTEQDRHWSQTYTFTCWACAL